MACYCSGAAIIAQEQEQQLPKLQQELAPGRTIASKRSCLLARYVTLALHSTYELVLIFMVHLYMFHHVTKFFRTCQLLMGRAIFSQQRLNAIKGNNLDEEGKFLLVSLHFAAKNRHNIACFGSPGSRLFPLALGPV